MQRGQVTIFIIVGVIIILLLGVGFYYRGKISAVIPSLQVGSLNSKEETVLTTVQDCVDKTLDNAHFLAEKQSGRIFLTNNSLSIEGVEVPYIYDNGYISVITLAELQEEFRTYLRQQVPTCAQGVNAVYDNFDSRVRITTNTVTADVSYPFSITLDDGTVLRNNGQYHSSVDQSHLVDFIQLMNAVSDATRKDPKNIPIGLLLNQNVFKIDTLPLEQEVFYSMEPFDQTNETYFFATNNGKL